MLVNGLHESQYTLIANDQSQLLYSYHGPVSLAESDVS